MLVAMTISVTIRHLESLLNSCEAGRRRYTRRAGKLRRPINARTVSPLLRHRHRLGFLVCGPLTLSVYGVTV